MKFDRDVAVIGALLPEPTLPNPFPPLTVPPFQPMEHGHWALMKDGRIGRVRGYFTPGYQDMKENWILVDKSTGTTWMSITPMELESQSHHAFAAHGNVLIGGLGMGVLAYNVAQKPEVRTVTVIERDASIIAMLKVVAEAWPDAWWSKVTIILGDAFDTPMRNAFDVALFDIWPMVGDTNLRPDLQRLKWIHMAGQWAAWGLEMDFVSWLAEKNIPMQRVLPQHWDLYSKSIGVPLILRNRDDMSALAMQAVIMGMKHETDKARRNR
jgi:hypothetical protein